MERQIGIIGFAHLTLQEYLVAIQIYASPDTFYKVMLNHLDDADWREVILLYAGMIGDVTKLVHQILFKTPDFSPKSLSGNNSLLLAAHCIGDSNSCDSKTIEYVIDQLMHLIDKTQDVILLEKIEDAVAALAISYKGEAKTIREKLSEKLIEDVKNHGTKR